MKRFEEILGKYKRIIANLGNGNFGLRKGFLNPFLYIQTPFSQSGELLIQNSDFGDSFDCLRTAFKMGGGA